LLPPLAPEVQSRYLEQSAKLVFHPLFYSWLPGGEEMTPFVQRLKEVQESRLVLSDYQKQTRQDAVVEEAVKALHPPESRPILVRRLLAMAHYLHLQGLGEESRAAQAAALDLAKGDYSSLAGGNPFLKALVQQALIAAAQAAPEEAEAAGSSGLILPPTESLLIRR